MSTDLDANGLVDGSELFAYQIFNNGSPITLRKGNNRTLSNSTSNKWNLIACAEINDTFYLLARKQKRRRETSYQIWTANKTGLINGTASDWVDGQTLAEAGYEYIFNVDLNEDDIINVEPGVSPNPVNEGSAIFIIHGITALGEVLTIKPTDSDPDGDGTLTVEWLASNQFGRWSVVSTDTQITVSPELEGRQIRAIVSYTDGKGFSELVSTESVLIPISNVDDYGALPGQTGSLSLELSKQGELETFRDRDWFTIDLENSTQYVFELTGITLEDPILVLRSSNGIALQSDDDGGDGLNSRLLYTSNYAGTYYLDIGSYANQTKGLYEIQATKVSTSAPSFNSEDGYGHINVSRAFETLLGISLEIIPDLGGNSWALDNINAPYAWSQSSNFSGVTGKGATIAIIDTGVDLDHPEFQGRIITGYDFVDKDERANDGNGHGTHVAGTIGGANDGVGVTGVAPDASIMPIRVLGDDGFGLTSDIIAGIYWATNNGADVINLSLGGDRPSRAMSDAIAYASNKGSVVVMAAGNSGEQTTGYPAAYAVSHGIAVGAANKSKDIADFSNRAGSTTLEYVTAPGVNIYSAIPGGGYDSFSGTSMAAPHVSGLAGLLKSYDNSLNAETIENLITESADYSAPGSTTGDFEDAITGQRQIISLESLANFDDFQLPNKLIGSIHGNKRARKTIFKELKNEMKNGSIIDSVQKIQSSKKKHVILNLSDCLHRDNIEFLENLLLSKQFGYFEADTQMTFV